MNNEERLLYACLNKNNLLKELPLILEYLDVCYQNVLEVNKSKSFKIKENDYLEFILDKGIEHYFSSKLKLYFDLEDYDDEPQPSEAKEKV